MGVIRYYIVILVCLRPLSSCVNDNFTILFGMTFKHSLHVSSRVTPSEVLQSGLISSQLATPSEAFISRKGAKGIQLWGVILYYTVILVCLRPSSSSTIQTILHQVSTNNFPILPGTNSKLSHASCLM